MRFGASNWNRLVAPANLHNFLAFFFLEQESAASITEQTWGISTSGLNVFHSLPQVFPMRHLERKIKEGKGCKFTKQLIESIISKSSTLANISLLLLYNILSFSARFSWTFSRSSVKMSEEKGVKAFFSPSEMKHFSHHEMISCLTDLMNCSMCLIFSSSRWANSRSSYQTISFKLIQNNLTLR